MHRLVTEKSENPHARFSLLVLMMLNDKYVLIFVFGSMNFFLAILLILLLTLDDVAFGMLL